MSSNKNLNSELERFPRSFLIYSRDINGELYERYELNLSPDLLPSPQLLSQNYLVSKNQ